MLFSRSLTTGPGVAPLLAPIKRRSFLTYAGATTLALAGCQKNDATPGATDVGSGNIGVLNLAYALEQVEAAFYTNVLAGSYYTKLPPYLGRVPATERPGPARAATRRFFAYHSLHQRAQAAEPDAER